MQLHEEERRKEYQECKVQAQIKSKEAVQIELVHSLKKFVRITRCYLIPH